MQLPSKISYLLRQHLSIRFSTLFAIITLYVLDWEAPGICIISYFNLEVSYNHGQLSVSHALHQCSDQH